MKKIICLILAAVMAFSLAACGEEPAQSTADVSTTAGAEVVQPTKDSEYDPDKVVDFDMKTSSENSIVTVGTIDKSLYAAPVLVTSFGQSTDAAMLDTVMKRIGVDYTYNPLATANDVASFKTVIIAVGASTKGLGAAGISEADETARAQAVMKAIEEKNIEVICCHIGGSSRRGALSDVYADMVMAKASYIVLKEDANFDYKFTKYAEDNNLPITLIYATKDILSVFTELFK